MIKSAKLSIKFANDNKKRKLNELIVEYRKALRFFVDKFWDEDKISKFNDSSIYNEFKHEWMSARLKQCVAKQAALMVKGTKKKNEARKAMLNKLKDEIAIKKLQEIIDKNPISKPDCNKVNPELDYRFVQLEESDNSSFDYWMIFKSIGLPMIKVPLKSSKPLNRLLENGKIKPGCRLLSDLIIINIEINDPIQIENGNTIGIDLGMITGIACSNGMIVEKDRWGHSISSICSKMSRLKPGSNAMLRAQRHRDNFMHWMVNQITLDGIKTICIEKLRDIGRGKRQPRKFKHWNFRLFLTILKSKLRNAGVHIIEVDPCCTSKRCSKCGRVRHANRKGKIYVCDYCGNTMDADLNASLNISMNLPSISKKARDRKEWIKGFFWNESGEHSDCRQEFIVPGTQKEPIYV